MNIEQLLLDRILFIGEQIPGSVVDDGRPKFVLLGTPQELIDAAKEQDDHRA